MEVQCWVQLSDFAFCRQSQGHQQEASAPGAGHADVEHGMQMPFACLRCSSTQETFMNLYFLDKMKEADFQMHFYWRHRKSKNMCALLFSVICFKLCLTADVYCTWIVIISCSSVEMCHHSVHFIGIQSEFRIFMLHFFFFFMFCRNEV